MPGSTLLNTHLPSSNLSNLAANLVPSVSLLPAPKSERGGGARLRGGEGGKKRDPGLFSSLIHNRESWGFKDEMKK